MLFVFFLLGLIGTWCKNQRWKEKDQRLTAEQKSKLDAIDFPWTIPEKDRRRRGKAKLSIRQHHTEQYEPFNKLYLKLALS